MFVFYLAPQTTLAALATQLREKTKNFDIEPDKGDHQTESGVPLHKLRSAYTLSRLDKIEVEHQVKGSDHHNKKG